MQTEQTQADLEACAREPIHIPGAIQPHGALLVLDPADGTVLQASVNAASILGVPLCAGASLRSAQPALPEDLLARIESDDDGVQQMVCLGGRRLSAAAHRTADALILEFETVPEDEEPSASRLFGLLRRFADGLPAAADVAAIAAMTARQVRALTGFDRVLVYRFDQDWNGHVIGEDGNGVLPSYLGLRFPAGDIPAQARQLYRLNRVRIIPDAGYSPVPIEPALDPRSGRPVDLSFALLRSVSPVHLEYMRNMGTAASMSISIILNGELWGLVSCHSREPLLVPLNVRDACDVAVQTVASEIAGRLRADDVARRLSLGEVTTRLLARMAGTSDWRSGLFAEEDDLLRQVDAQGAAVVFDDECLLAGSCPPEPAVRAIVDWLEQTAAADHVATASLAAELPSAEPFADTASGLLAVRISELHPSWLLWFRPEVVRTVTWGGDPHKVVREAGRIHPRRSFEAWKEQVRLQAEPWGATEVDAARDLRNDVVSIVLRRAEELAQLSEELQRSNSELEAFSYSISHDLRAPFRHIVGFSELLRERESALDERSRHYLNSISESATAAGRLVDDLLNFSRLGRATLSKARVDMQKIVVEVRQSLAATARERRIDWSVGTLPEAYGDPVLLRQVWYNLLENAVKYTRTRDPAEIAVCGEVDGNVAAYTVRDNGVGFDMKYVGKLFGVFQRLQRAEDFEGTGIGLALARRIIERHGGEIQAEGEVERGAVFRFTLPVQKTED